MNTKLLFTWNVGKMDGVWPQIFPIDVHGFTFHKKQASRLLWWAVKGRRLQLKWSEVLVMVGDKLWLCLRCFHILTGTTTQKDHAGVSQKFNGTPGGYSHEDTQVDLERKSLLILRNVIFSKTHTLYLEIFWWPYLFRIDHMQEYSIWRSSGKELCITE